jgi:hypothetical protein
MNLGVMRQADWLLLLVSCLAYASTLKTEAICSSETSCSRGVTTQKTVLFEKYIIQIRINLLFATMCNLCSW